MSNIPSATGSSIIDLINLEELRIPQNFADQIGVQKILSTIPTRKPGAQAFIRTHPDPAYRLEAFVLEMKDDRETFLVHPSILPAVTREVKRKVLVTAIDRQGTLFLWPINLPDERGRLDSWSQSALEAEKLAREQWVRLSSNFALGAYEIFAAMGNNYPEPEWPDKSFSELINIAFRDRFITALDHPALLRLRGEI